MRLTAHQRACQAERLAGVFAVVVDTQDQDLVAALQPPLLTRLDPLLSGALQRDAALCVILRQGTEVALEAFLERYGERLRGDALPRSHEVLTQMSRTGDFNALRRLLCAEVVPRPLDKFLSQLFPCSAHNKACFDRDLASRLVRLGASLKRLHPEDLLQALQLCPRDRLVDLLAEVDAKKRTIALACALWNRDDPATRVLIAQGTSYRPELTGLSAHLLKNRNRLTTLGRLVLQSDSAHGRLAALKAAGPLEQAISQLFDVASTAV